MSDLFDIPGDIVAKAEESRAFKLNVPENARRNRRDPRIAFWMEAGVITAASSGTYENEKTAQTVSTLSFTVEINGEGSGLNVNKPLTATMRINNNALRDGEPKSQVTMSFMSIAMLKSLFNAMNVASDLPNGGYSKLLLDKYFPAETQNFPAENSMLVGSTVYFEVKQGPRELGDGSLRESAEISKILMPPV